MCLSPEPVIRVRIDLNLKADGTYKRRGESHQSKSVVSIKGGFPRQAKSLEGFLDMDRDIVLAGLGLKGVALNPHPALAVVRDVSIHDAAQQRCRRCNLTTCRRVRLPSHEAATLAGRLGSGHQASEGISKARVFKVEMILPLLPRRLVNEEGRTICNGIVRGG